MKKVKWRGTDLHFMTMLMILILSLGMTAVLAVPERTTAAGIAAPEPIFDEPPAEIGTESEQDQNEIGIGIYSERPELPEMPEPAIDIDLVARCIEAEAGTEDLDGKRLVADCIYNMVDAPEYPDNVTDVIMRPGAFSVVESGRIWSVTPSEDSYTAAYMEIENRISWEILYFRAGRYHNFGTPWGKWGTHYFSTR